MAPGIHDVGIQAICTLDYLRSPSWASSSRAAAGKMNESKRTPRRALLVWPMLLPVVDDDAVLDTSWPQGRWVNQPYLMQSSLCLYLTFGVIFRMYLNLLWTVKNLETWELILRVGFGEVTMHQENELLLEKPKLLLSIFLLSEFPVFLVIQLMGQK